MRSRLTILVFLCFSIALNGQTKWHLKGSASTLAGGCVQLTPASLSQAGAAWNPVKINLNKGFDLGFHVYFGTQDASGADGIAFILQNDSNGISAIGQAGGALGWCATTGKGIHPSVGIEMDTYDNEPTYPDSTWDHMAVILNGDLLSQPLGPVPALPNKGNIENGRVHLLRITYDTAHNLKAYFDCNLRLSYNSDLVKTIFKGDSMVYYGFTGGTGGLDNIQQICEIAPHISNGKTASICYGTSIKLNGTNDSGFIWTPKTGLSCTKCSSTIASPTITTTYYYKSDDTCMHYKDSIIVTVTGLAAGSHSFKDTTICKGKPVSMYIGYAHNLRCLPEGVDSLLDSSTVLFTPTVTTTYTVTYYKPCRFPDTVYYTISVNQPDTVTVNASVCYGKRYTLPNGHNVASAGYYSVILNNTKGCDSVIHITLSIKPVTFSTQTISICNGKIYTLPKGEAISAAGVYRDTFVNSMGCDSVVTTTLHLLHTNSIYDSVTICNGQTHTLRKGEQVSAAGLYTDTFVNILGCDSIYYTTIQLIFAPPTSIEQYVLCYYDSVLLQSPVPNATYLWQNGSSNAGYFASSAGLFTVAVTLSPCIPVFDSFYIYMKQCDTLLEIPTAFTPNGDGVNDVFFPIHLGGITIKEFRVYNRWGRVVYDKPVRGWDGTYKGIKQPQGTYYYTVLAEYMSGIQVKQLEKKGDVELLR